MRFPQAGNRNHTALASKYPNLNKSLALGHRVDYGADLGFGLFVNHSDHDQAFFKIAVRK